MTFWNETREAVLMKLRSEGLSHHAIADRMSEECDYFVTDGMVQSALRRVKKRKQFIEPPHEETWTPERTAMLKKRWAEGISARLIAEELGVGRSAVISKKDRLGLPDRSTVASIMRSRPVAGSAAESMARKIKAVAKANQPKPGRIAMDLPPIFTKTLPGSRSADGPEPRKWDVRPLPGSKPALLIDLDFNQCRWPLEEKDGIRGRFLMCGAKTFSGCYCHEHWERSLTPEARARLAAKLKHAA